ncbi:unnamed protein product [Closterium sp. Naga37s-1]|nr:unnamed protein product [Closterium sp. Naga37s-1]
MPRPYWVGCVFMCCVVAVLPCRVPLSSAAGGVGVGSTESLSAYENQFTTDRTLAAAGLIRLERMLKTRIATVEAMLKSLQHEREGMGEGREVSEEREEGEGEREGRGGKEDEEDDLPSWVDTAGAAAAAGAASGSRASSVGGSEAGRELVVEGDEWDESRAKVEGGKAAESGQVPTTTQLNPSHNIPSFPPRSPTTTLPPQLSLLLSHLTPLHLPPVCRTDPTTHSLSPISASLFPPPPRLIPWNPHPHRYLLATCTHGRTSNHLLCIRRYLAFAALLNRSLLLPVVHPASGGGASRDEGACTSPHSLPDASVSGLPLSRVQSYTRRQLVGRERRSGSTQISGNPAANIPDRRALGASGVASGVAKPSGVLSGVLSGAPPEWMDLGVALDVAGLQQCVGQGRVVTVDEYLRGEGVGSGGEGWMGRLGGLWNQKGGRRREVEVKMWWWWHGGESVRATCQRFIREAPWAKLLPHNDDDGVDVGADGATASDSNSATGGASGSGGNMNNGDTNGAAAAAASEANRNNPAHLARIYVAAPIPAASVSLHQFLFFFGQRTEQVIGLGDVFEVTGKVDVGQVDVGQVHVGQVHVGQVDVGQVDVGQVDVGDTPGSPGTRDTQAQLLADKLLEGHASSDGLPGLYDGVNGAVPILPPCRLAMRPHPAALSAAHAFARRVLGTRFAALHLRRTDFATHCLRPGFRCWLPLSQIARCVADRINALDAAAAAAAREEEGVGPGGTEQQQHTRVGTLFVATDTTDQVSESVALLEAGVPCWLPLSQVARCVADRINALDAAAAAAAREEEGVGPGGTEQQQHTRVGTLFVATDTTDQVSESVALLEAGVPCWLPLSQVARCVADRINALNAAAGAGGKEGELRWFSQMLKSLVWGELSIIQYPRSKSAAPGAAELQAAGIISHSSTRSTVEKMVCVHALVFWGTPRSTFSKDVMRMRGALGVAHCGDDWVCGGEETEDAGVREISKRMNG